jgi:hypothetical protein
MFVMFHCIMLLSWLDLYLTGLIIIALDQHYKNSFLYSLHTYMFASQQQHWTSCLAGVQNGTSSHLPCKDEDLRLQENMLSQGHGTTSFVSNNTGTAFSPATAATPSHNHQLSAYGRSIGSQPLYWAHLRPDTGIAQDPSVVGELTHSRWHYNLYGINIHLMIR